MDPEKEPAKLDELKKALFSKNKEFSDTFALDLRDHKVSPESSWKHDEEDVPRELPPVEPQKKGGFVKWLFILSIIFFIGALSFFGFMFLRGEQTISSGNIDIQVVAPTRIGSGEETAIDIVVRNDNNVDIRLSEIIVEYPKGTKSSVDRSTDLPRERLDIGDIKKGETVRRTVRPVVFGEEGAVVAMDIALQYRLEGSQSVFEKEIVYEVPIGTSPVVIKVESQKEINAGQDIPLTVTIESNSDDVVKNLLLFAEFPSGFEVRSTEPKTVPEKNIWRLGDIEALGKRTVKVVGRVYGNQNEEKFFRFSLGSESSKESLRAESLFAKTEKSVLVKRPFIATTLSFGSGGESATNATPGKNISFGLEVENNLDVPILDGEVTMSVRGSMVNKGELSSDKGFYRSSTNIISWTKFEEERLAIVGPGEKVNLRVNGELFGAFSKEASGRKNESIEVDITVKGKRISEDNVPEEIVSTVTKKIPIDTEITMSSKIVHNGGSIVNNGDIPPRVDKETEYTVTWNVTNSLNDIQNAKIVAVLPSYVTWKNAIYPTTEKVTYNNETREVVWDMSKIMAGGGINGSFKQVSFKIGFTPSLSQVGSSPVLLRLATFSGRDTFTGTEIKVTNRELTTVLIGDPNYTFGNDKVIE